MKLKYNFVTKNVMDMNVAVATGESARKLSSIIKLNDTGKRIFDLLLEGKQEEEIVQTLMEEYEIDEPALRQNVTDFLNTLEKEGILER